MVAAIAVAAGATRVGTAVGAGMAVAVGTGVGDSWGVAVDAGMAVGAGVAIGVGWGAAVAAGVAVGAATLGSGLEHPTMRIARATKVHLIALAFCRDDCGEQHDPQDDNDKGDCVSGQTGYGHAKSRTRLLALVKAHPSERQADCKAGKRDECAKHRDESEDQCDDSKNH